MRAKRTKSVNGDQEIVTNKLAQVVLAAYFTPWQVLPFPCRGQIPVALNTSEGAGSVRIVVWLPGAHLCKQVLGN